MYVGRDGAGGGGRGRWGTRQGLSLGHCAPLSVTLSSGRVTGRVGSSPCGPWRHLPGGPPLTEGLSCLPWDWLWRRRRGLCEGLSTWAAARPAWAHARPQASGRPAGRDARTSPSPMWIGFRVRDVGWRQEALASPPPLTETQGVLRVSVTQASRGVGAHCGGGGGWDGHSGQEGSVPAGAGGGLRQLGQAPGPMEPRPGLGFSWASARALPSELGPQCLWTRMGFQVPSTERPWRAGGQETKGPSPFI